MPAATARALISSLRNGWIRIARLILIGATLIGTRAEAQQSGATPSPQTGPPKVTAMPVPPTNRSPDWLIATPVVTIGYETKRDATSGISTIQNGAPAEGSPRIDIKWQNAAERPSGILVILKFTYQGVPYTYKSRDALKPDKDGVFSIDLVPLAKKLIDDLQHRLRRDFDPNSRIVLDGPVSVEILYINDNPVPDHPPNGGYSVRKDRAQTSNDLMILLQAKGGGEF